MAARQRRSAARSKRPAPPQQLRIIGGRWRSRLLPVASRPGLRPTPDRVRETLFNWLGQDLGGWSCIDAFAGTGALGFEAASRGADAVLLIEQDPALVRQLEHIRQQLQADTVRIQRVDVLHALAGQPAASIDLVLLDPPFEAPELFAPALAAATRVLRPDGWLYLEAPERWDDARLADLGLQVHRHLQAGAVHAHLLGLVARSSA